MFINMLRIEQTKLFNRKLLWIELGLMGVFVTITLVAIYALRFDPAMPEELTSQLNTFLTWPGAFINMLELAAGNNLGGLLVLVLVGAMVAQEYTWNTMSLWLAHGAPRVVVIGAKFLTMFLATFLVVLTTLVVGGMVSGVLSVIINGDLNAAGVDFWQVALGAFRTAYTLFPYVGLAFFLAIATRSTLATIGGSLAYAAIVEGIIGQILSMLSGGGAKLVQYLPSMLAQSVMKLNNAVDVEAMMMEAAPEGETITMAAAQLLEPQIAVVMIAVYTLVFVGLSVWAFQRQDLTS